MSAENTDNAVVKFDGPKIIGRRGFLSGIASMLAAPAIVHAGNLMPIKAFPPKFLFIGCDIEFDYWRVDVLYGILPLPPRMILRDLAGMTIGAA